MLRRFPLRTKCDISGGSCSAWPYFFGVKIAKHDEHFGIRVPYRGVTSVLKIREMNTLFTQFVTSESTFYGQLIVL